MDLQNKIAIIRDLCPAETMLLYGRSGHDSLVSLFLVLIDG